MTTIYISIGNSDDKLSQADWSTFCKDVDGLVDEYAHHLHGLWLSDPSSPFQNCCWCVEVSEEHELALRNWLAKCAAEYRQESIAWAVAKTEFIGPEAGGST